MKSNKTNKQYPVAWPLALCYGLGVRLRNLCFGLGILPSETYPIAVISVGNLSAGGAGKTPLVEYLVRLLSPRYRVAVLSRGYRRKTKGYVLARDRRRAQPDQAQIPIHHRGRRWPPSAGHASPPGPA